MKLMRAYAHVAPSNHKPEFAHSIDLFVSRLDAALNNRMPANVASVVSDVV